MRMIGWCLKCRKVKHVRVSAHQLTQRVVIGICASCEETTTRTTKKGQR